MVAAAEPERTDEFIIQGAGQQKFTTVDRNGVVRTYDMDNPSREMLKQLCDVASRRVDANEAVLRMLYIENDAVPDAALPIRDIFQALVDGQITPEQAKEDILKLKESL